MVYLVLVDYMLLPGWLYRAGVIASSDIRLINQYHRYQWPASNLERKRGLSSDYSRNTIAGLQNLVHIESLGWDILQCIDFFPKGMHPVLF